MFYKVLMMMKVHVNKDMWIVRGQKNVLLKFC